MSVGNIRYSLPPETGQTLIFTNQVLEVLSKNRQITRCSRENGGMLFAQINSKEITIEAISTPRKRDWRSRFGIVINRKDRESLPKKMYNKGLHFIGEWHTHPESIPTPSNLDLKSMKECFNKSTHKHPFFIMVIVGNSKTSINLYVSAHNSSGHVSLDRL